MIAFSNMEIIAANVCRNLFVGKVETEIAEYNSGSQHLQNSTCHCGNVSVVASANVCSQVSTHDRLFPP